MILVFDVGNTETTIGLFDGETLEAHWRVTSDLARTADEIGVLLRALLRDAGFDPAAVQGTAIGSVVPGLTGRLHAACKRTFSAGEPLIVDAQAGLPITLDVEEPMTVGADRIINTLAASRLFQRDAIVVDLGTATTYDCITADGVFLGGVIAPGVQTSADTLVRRTSKLPATELVMPARVIGRRTEECIRAGIMFGAVDQIDGMVRRIKEAWPRPDHPLVIATGGFGEMFAALCREVDRADPYLTLQGLAIAFGLLRREY